MEEPATAARSLHSANSPLPSSQILHPLRLAEEPYQPSRRRKPNATVLVRVGFDELALRQTVKEAGGLGNVTGVIHAAGVSPSQAPVAAILKVDIDGTAVILEVFGNVIARGGSGVVIASQSGHRLGALTDEQNKLLATTPADQLLSLPMLQPNQVKDALHAYQLSKRGNALRVMAESVRWGKRGARVNTISPGIIITPLAKDELTGPRGEGYRHMIEGCPVGRAGTSDCDGRRDKTVNSNYLVIVTILDFAECASDQVTK